MRKGENAINTELTIFNNEQFGEIRTLLIDDEPWFVGRDLAKALGYGKGNKDSKALTNAIADHVDEEDKVLLPYSEFKNHQNGDLKNISHYGALIVNESGLYALIFGSTLKEAKQFKRWVTSEVLPAIRKTGKYDPSSDLKDSLKVEDCTDRIRHVAKYGTYEDFCQMLNPALIAIGGHLGMDNRRVLATVYHVYADQYGTSIGEIRDKRIVELSQREEDKEELEVFMKRSTSALRMIYDMPELHERIIGIIRDMIQEYDLHSKVEKFVSVYSSRISDASMKAYLG